MVYRIKESNKVYAYSIFVAFALYNSTLGAMLHAHYVGAKPKTAWAELAFVDRR